VADQLFVSQCLKRVQSGYKDFYLSCFRKTQMEIIDKKNILNRISEIGDLRIELGCGSHKRNKDAVGIDALDYECVDIVGNAYDVLGKIPDNSVSTVYSYHFFEHLADIAEIMKELARIIKDNGLLVVVTPHFSNPYYYSDYTHKNQFGLYSFSYLSENSFFKRKVPRYDKSLEFELRKVNLIFLSPRPFYVRWGFKKIFQVIVNLNRYLMEFYEENLCYIVPCYEIRYEMTKKGHKPTLAQNSL
jgi:SAM-dependent methyltransferase